MEEAGIRLSLQGRRELAAGLQDTEGDLDDVGDAAEDAGKKADTSSRRWKRLGGIVGATGRGIRRAASTIGRGIATAAKVGVVGLAALTAAAGAASYKAIGLASDARETGSAFRTVFGPDVKTVRKELGGLTREFGLYNPELQDAARQFGVFGKAAKIPRKDLAKFSTSLVQAGLDLSSFYNSDPGETFQALQSGLSGEAEPLRKFGIFISDATMKAQAAQMGLTDELTEQQKVMVRQRLIMKSLGDAQGDLARTSAGFANQQRGAEGRVRTFLTLLGGPLTTAATGAFRGFNTIAQKGIRMLRRSLPGLEGDAERLSDRFERWGNQAAKRLPWALGQVKGAADTVRGAVKRLRKSWRDFTDNGGDRELATLGDNMAALGPGIAAASAELPGLSDGLAVTNTVTGFLADHTDTLIKFMPAIVAGFLAYKTAQLAANVATAAAVPLKILDIAATRQLRSEMKQLIAVQGGVVASSATSTAAIGGQAAATGAATGAQRGLNIAMRANPIGLLITGATLLIGGFVLLYQHSETFRTAVDWLWNKALKPFGKWIGGAMLGYVKTLGQGWILMARAGIKGFTFLLHAALGTFDGILWAAEKGLGWVPGLGDKIKGARAAFNEFGDATISKLGRLDEKLAGTSRRLDDLGRDRSATINITTAYSTLGSPTRGRADEYGPRTFVPTGGGATPAPDTPDRGGASGRRKTERVKIPRRPREPQRISLEVDGRTLAEVVTDKMADEGARR